MDNYEKIIKENAQKYYTTGTQNISDETFDALTELLKEHNPKAQVLTTGWGYEVDENGKIKHKYGHISGLKKAHNWKEITNLLGKNSLDYVDVSAKLDGMSVVLYYNKGKLEKAVTRGNGEYGRDITNKIEFLIGNHIKDNSFKGAVRGEILMCPTDFEQYKKDVCPNAENARNTAAGLINGDDLTNYKYLKLFVYSIVAFEEQKDLDIADVESWLKDNFKYNAPRKRIILNSSDFESVLLTMKNFWENELNIDGVVITLPKIQHQANNEMKIIACAFKFEDEVKISTVKSIEWILSKYGVYVPVANIEPIRLEGTTVKRVSLYNAQRVIDLGIEIGSIVAVCKRNQIIPYIKEVVK